MLNCRGRVVVSGIGKSGHIARKVAATLASTGTPAFFVHPAEASHGDLGMITPDDVVLMLSNSGETDELVLLMPHLKRQGAKIIALTGNEASSLAQEADVHLDAAVDAKLVRSGSRRPRARPPRSRSAMRWRSRCSTHAASRSRISRARTQAARSVAGCLTRVRRRDAQRARPAHVGTDATLAQAVVEMSGKGMGMTAVVDDGGRVAGIFTDGDLRRCLERGPDISDARRRRDDATPRTIGAGTPRRSIASS